MRDLELAGYPAIDARPFDADARRFSLPRAAVAVSVAVHLVVGYALGRHEWPPSPPPPSLVAEFIPLPRPQPAAPLPEPVVVAEPELAPEPAPLPPETRERSESTPAPRAAEVDEPPSPLVTLELSPEAREPPQLLPAPRESPDAVELDEARQRAAAEVVAERSAGGEYLTFSLDDVAPPRAAEPVPRPSIFDGGAGGPRGPRGGQVGQARTRLGHRLTALCNALTGGFSLMGWGSFCAGPSDGGLSGLFPEVRPEYLDLMPDCVDTRDTAPALALEAPFPTVKCRLVRRDDAAALRP